MVTLNGLVRFYKPRNIAFDLSITDRGLFLGQAREALENAVDMQKDTFLRHLGLGFWRGTLNQEIYDKLAGIANAQGCDIVVIRSYGGLLTPFGYTEVFYQMGRLKHGSEGILRPYFQSISQR